jgi:hypothetical protein
VWTCRIRPLGAEIVVGCDESLATALEQHLSPWKPETSRARPDAVLLGAGGTASLALQVGSRIMHTGSSVDGLMVGLQNWIDGEVTRAAPGLIAVHAGVVGWDNSVILLPGTSGAGKTSLVAALVDRGAAYYSDELAFVDERGWAHPYPRHPIVRDALGIGRPSAVRPASAAPLPAAPVRMIVGVRYATDANWQVSRLAASEALLLLLANTAHRLSPEGVPAALLRAAASASSYSGRRGDAATASAAILKLFACRGRL